MWDLIVSVPDHCFSFYLVILYQASNRAYRMSILYCHALAAFVCALTNVHYVKEPLKIHMQCLELLNYKIFYRTRNISWF